MLVVLHSFYIIKYLYRFVDFANDQWIIYILTSRFCFQKRYVIFEDKTKNIVLRNDYACVLLVDRRYLKRSVQSKLPEWISAHINHSNDNFPACFSSIRKVCIINLF